MPRRSHIAVKLARNASPKDLAVKLAASYDVPVAKIAAVEVPFHDATTRLELYNLKSLPVEIREWIWDLFERNMRSSYEASDDGWKPQEKRKELFHAESRFIVLQSGDQEEDGIRRSKGLGYALFRFDTEETAGDEDADVLYCYELQIDSESHRLGAGKLLMQALNRIGLQMKMDKTILTVFKANTSAIAFYEKIGFSTDEIDPSNYGEQVDYLILSNSYSE
ncbi:hypothetical protein JCM3766R1_002991 [Sporobolomyces carnicolor]